MGVWEEGIFKEKGNFFEILAFYDNLGEVQNDVYRNPLGLETMVH